jgi:Leucine-rich repeat (LRR) protein
VGAATAKAALKFWLQDEELLATAGGDLTSLLASKLPGFIERRRAGTLFERIAEDVAVKLEPFFAHEFSGLADGEREAAAIAVANVLDQASLDLQLVIEHDLDPLALERELRERSPGMADKALLSGDGQQLFDLALREVCNYVSELATTLPRFSDAATIEMLRRESELLGLAKQILDELPSSQGTLSELGSDAVRFEDQYRKEAARVLDRLALFGLGGSESVERYSLSVAYITLSAADLDSGDQEEQSKSNPEHADGGDDAADERYVRVDEALADAPRAVIRGEAGSGKTTLLQWLAVNSVRDGFKDSLEALNGSVPFFIQLRRYVGAQLPTPSEFLAHTAPSLSGIVPPGWVEAVLEEGRALVLIDGVDELPDSQRDQVKEWIAGLCNVFPQSRYVVTSRPPALANEWLGSESFRHCELQPMDIDDVDAFVDHWHAAAEQQVVDDDERELLGALGDKLRRDIRGNRSIRSLASSPLLCAVLCTLNRSRRAHLPRDRVELYRFALDLLLDRRDVEREIPGLTGVTLRQKTVLAQDLAYWLVLNNQTHASKDDAVEVVERKLAELGDVDATASEVFEFLLLRSGLFREPVEGRVDFIHRTFQEYLAAEEAVEQNHVGVLLERAATDDWDEVVVLAAGVARAEQREALINGLLKRGWDEPAIQHRMHLLAVACLETAPALSIELRGAVQDCIAALMPPRHMSEAKALSSAGNLAVPLLGKYWTHNVGIARACVRALALIGTSEALAALEKFGPDRRVTVARELLNCWSYFDGVEYCEKVLRASSLGGGRLTVTDRDRLPGLKFLTGLTTLRVRLSGDGLDLGSLASLPQLRYLQVVRSNISDLAVLSGHQGLETVRLSQCKQLASVAPLGETSVSSLSIGGPSIVTDVSMLEGLRALTVFGMLDLEPSTVSELVRIERLTLARSGLVQLPELRNLTELRHLNVSGNRDLNEFDNAQALSGLTHVTLERTGLMDLRIVGAWPALEELRVDGTVIDDLSPLVDCEKLLRLDLVSCENITDISPLADVTNLTHLDLEGCGGVQDISSLQGHPKLAWIDLTDTAIEDLSCLTSLPSLKRVWINGIGQRQLAELRKMLPAAHVRYGWSS